MHAVVARSTCQSQHVKSTTCSDHFWKLRCPTFRCRFAWQAQGILHLAKSEQIVRVLSQFQLRPLHYTPLQLQLHYITLHCTNYITLHSTPLTTATATATSTLHCITLRYTNYIALVYTTPPYTTPHYANYNYNYTTRITLHYATPHHANYNYSYNYNYATLHTLRQTTLHYPTLHYTTLNTELITLHHNYNSTTLQVQLQLHYTTLHPAVAGEVTDQVTTATIVTTPKKHNSNHLSVHKWIRSAIRDSQQPSSPIGFLF